MEKDTVVVKYGPPSGIFYLLGLGMIGLVGSVGLSDYLSTKRHIAETELEKARVERGCVQQERDLNGNGILEKFYTIDGKIAIFELDGKPLSSSLETNVLKEE